jgi:hypothetical protein
VLFSVKAATPFLGKAVLSAVLLVRMKKIMRRLRPSPAFLAKVVEVHRRPHDLQRSLLFLDGARGPCGMLRSLCATYR